MIKAATNVPRTQRRKYLCAKGPTKSSERNRKIVGQVVQLYKEVDETYNLSVRKILKRATSPISGKFVIEMLDYFEAEAQNALTLMGEAECIPKRLLRRYLLVGAKIAVIEFVMRHQTQAALQLY
jgi:hypothetical protein